MYLLELFESNAVPVDQLFSQEFNESVHKAGSLISILENKKLNFTNLFVLLLEKSDYRNIFLDITCCQCFRESLYLLLKYNPSLVKSKIVKSAIKKYNARTSN